MNARENYEVWCNRLEKEDPLYRELEEIAGNEAEITDCSIRKSYLARQVSEESVEQGPTG